MRWLVASAVVIGVASAASASVDAFGSHVTRHPVFTTATGRVARLDLSTIKVGPTTCSFSTKSAELAQEFDVGENVTIVCVRGVLRTIVLQPITGGHASPSPMIVAPVQGGRPTSSSGSSPASGAVTAQSAEGLITALTATSITVGGVTCPFSASSPIAPELQVGDFVSISCGTNASGSFSTVAS